MAFQQGVLTNSSDVKAVIQQFLVNNGWSWDSGTSKISKGNVVVDFSITQTDKYLFKASSLSGSICPRSVGMGRMVLDGSNNTPALITFPCNYYAFLNDDEFYFIVNYDTTRYQFVAWGQSQISTGINGSGVYISGTVNDLSPSASYTNRKCAISIDAFGLNNLGNASRSAAPFWDSQQFTYTSGTSIDLSSSFVHTDLETDSWELLRVNPSNTALKIGVGNNVFGNISSVLPNTWNGESPLLPIRAYRHVAESKVSLVLDLKNARQCRIDNFADSETITIGSDAWMIFPFHRRDTSARNGANNTDHTGTFGWAIRKVI